MERILNISFVLRKMGSPTFKLVSFPPPQKLISSPLSQEQILDPLFSTITLHVTPHFLEAHVLLPQFLLLSCPYVIILLYIKIKTQPQRLYFEGVENIEKTVKMTS